ncbi:TetR/AcrR family transcriptional regulator [Pseudoteredinibacter isoporae]|uniref:AcrR family transcriptional regulator n=1 Tax=Pseudoteredinibacter isoporae TaxID=570281 RepID=A0A7X0MUF8_9GAMM|nr:TetR/AcrR family transcriptional regulator [Pseudoteredinibacter isoporae]MBB6520233.1 AcrR family transcriptional regulator [Pseudoteredinibacter isoporae]NHO85805.1 TetR/AcrR family transcriptional regulator [Pseudoteredinibacter isoporae]NIB25743.1 TetR/AcrR family transcriptional regulator [Pseudoteredinibacter isoporae]
MSSSATRRSPITKQGEETVNKILDAVEQLLATIGYAQLTARKISTQAGIGTGSFYQYFSNKTEAVEALAKRWLDGIEDTFYGCLEECRESETIAEAITSIFQEILQRHYGNYAAYEEIYNIRSRSESLDNVMTVHNQRIADGIGQLLDNFEIQYNREHRADTLEFIRVASIFLISQTSFQEGESRQQAMKMSLSMLQAMFDVDLD